MTGPVQATSSNSVYEVTVHPSPSPVIGAPSASTPQTPHHGSVTPQPISDDVYEAPEDAYWDVIGSERVHILDSADAVRLAGCARRAVVDVARDRMRADIVTALREVQRQVVADGYFDDICAARIADRIEAKVIAP